MKKSMMYFNLNKVPLMDSSLMESMILICCLAVCESKDDCPLVSDSKQQVCSLTDGLERQGQRAFRIRLHRKAVMQDDLLYAIDPKFVNVSACDGCLLPGKVLC